MPAVRARRPVDARFFVEPIARAPLPTLHGASLVALGSVTVGALGGLLMFSGLQRVSAERAGMLLFLEPIAAVLVAWHWFGEAPGLSAIVGIGLVLSAGFMTIREPPATNPGE